VKPHARTIVGSVSAGEIRVGHLGRYSKQRPSAEGHAASEYGPNFELALPHRSTRDRLTTYAGTYVASGTPESTRWASRTGSRSSTAQDAPVCDRRDRRERGHPTSSGVEHLKVLADSGIVSVEPRARQRIYHLQAEPFDRMARWVDSFERLWEARLDSLAGYLQPTETEEGQS